MSALFDMDCEGLPEELEISGDGANVEEPGGGVLLLDWGDICNPSAEIIIVEVFDTITLTVAILLDVEENS